MRFILLIFILFINHSQSLEWNCTKTNDYLFLNIYEQCTITIEYLSLEQEIYICITHKLLIKNLPLLSFSSNYIMKIFKINSCQLLTLNQLPFSLPTSLEKLDLSYNLLSTFTLSYPLPSYIKYLYLDYNSNLIYINFNYHQQLIGLSLRYNKNLQLISLPENLIELDLTDCNLLNSSILLVLKSLIKLKFLSLSNNQLKQIPLLNEQIQLKYLNLSNNSLTFIENKFLYQNLEILDLKFNQIKSLEFFKERLKINQTLEHNNQTTITPILQLSLHGNPLICDCWLGSILNSSSINITDLSSLECNSHSIVNMSHNDFLCSYSQHCSSDCSCCDFEACDCHSICPSECLCLHDNLWLQHIIKCQKSNLSNIHIFLPETITELNYEDNNIEELKPFIFVGKIFLTKLNLAKNNIKILTNETFCAASNLQEINLSYNPNLLIILPNINQLFNCLKFLQYIILSKEQINNEEEISNGWIIDTNNDLIRLRRITQQSPLVLFSNSTLYTTLISNHYTDIQPSTIFSIYHQELFTSSNIIQHNQILIIIVFFLLLFILLFLILLISLAICRRKIRRHLTVELQRQRSQHYYYHHHHTNLPQTSIKILDNNEINGINDSLYEQLPSLSSDSEQPFLYNDKKLNNINAPALPPYPPTFRPYHCCHSTNSHEYQYTINSSLSNSQQNQYPTVLVLGNQLLYSNSQQENNSMRYCNNETVFLPTTHCRCNNNQIHDTDTYIYPNVNR